MAGHICDPLNREAGMAVIERNASGAPTVWCDPCIADVVGALNAAGLRTIASCCGHGHRPGSIALEDGRHLIIATGVEATIIDAAFPVDINGVRRDGR